MLNNKLMVLTIFIISLLAITAVSAADNATEDIVSIKNDNQLITLYSNDKLSVNNYNGDVLEIGEKELVDNLTKEEFALTNYNFNQTKDNFNDNVLSKEGKDENVLSANPNIKYDDNEDSSELSQLLLKNNGKIVLNRDYNNVSIGIDASTVWNDWSLEIDGNNHNINGAISIYCKVITLKNIIFDNPGHDSTIGGFLYIDRASYSKTTIKNCTFIGGVADYGGAIGIVGGNSYNTPSSLPDVYISNCRFINNHAYKTGGAIYTTAMTSITSCIFINNIDKYNSAVYGGYEGYDKGIYSISSSILLNNTLSCNQNIKNDCTANNNWWGNTDENYSAKPLANNMDVASWYFLNMTSENKKLYYGDTATISYQFLLFDSASNTSSFYKSNSLPMIKFNLISNIGYETSFIIKNGLGKVNFKSNDSFISIIVSYYDIKHECNLIFHDPGRLYSSNLVVYKSNSNQFIVQIRDGNITIPNMDVSITVNGVTKTLKTDINGLINLSLDLNPGKYDITSKYIQTNQIKSNTITILSTIKVLASIINVGDYYEVQFLDKMGQPLKYEEVSFKIGYICYVKTNSKGIAKIKVGLSQGKYEIQSINPITGESKTNKITIKKATPKFVAKAKTFKLADKTKKYVVIFKDNKNVIIKNKMVYIKVAGITYSAKTDAKGQATFKLTKLKKVGSFNAGLTFKGNAYYNKCYKTVKIVVKK